MTAIPAAHVGVFRTLIPSREVGEVNSSKSEKFQHISAKLRLEKILELNDAWTAFVLDEYSSDGTGCIRPRAPRKSGLSSVSILDAKVEQKHLNELEVR